MPITFERLQPITRGYPQIIQLVGGIELHQLSEHDTMKVSGEAPAWVAGEKPLRLTISEALDHTSSITPRVTSVKQLD